MGLVHSPRIVTDGLVFALDVGNPKSYPGSGTSWTDTVGGNNGTLTNGLAYSRDNGGYLEFSNSNSYIQLSSPVLTTPSTYSVEMWVKMTDTTTDSIFLSNLDANQDGFELKFNGANGNWVQQINGVASNTIGATVNEDQWYHVVFYYDGNLGKTFVNGVQIQSGGFGSQTLNITTASRIGSKSYENNQIWNSFEIGALRVYNNKVLTQAEILQNYNATKSRYDFVWSLPAPPVTGTVFDFTGGSLPSGMYQDSDGPTVTWGANSVELAGNAPNDGASYPLRVATSFTGDYLFQLSTRINLNPGSTTEWCSDAGIGLFNTAYNTSDWTWKWGILSGRIAAQNNCDTPTLYGHTNTTQMTGPNNGDVLMTPYVADGGWITMHLYHEPSQNRTRYKITLGEKDWDASGTQIGNAPNNGVLEISDYFSGTYYVGISADDDDDECHMNGFRYVAL